MTLKIKDADGQVKHVATTGTGTADDPLKTEQSVVVTAMPNITATVDEVTIGAAIPAGTNNIGDVDIASFPTGMVTGDRLKVDTPAIRALSSSTDSLAATQSGTWTVGLSAGNNNIGDVDIASFPAAMVATDRLKVVATATDFDIRDLSSTTDSIAVVQSGTWSVGVSNFPTSFQVSNFPATQTIAGSVSVSNFPTSFQVSNFPATQTIAGSVSVSNFPSTQPISAASLPLPTGAATQATLATLLTEGVVATGVTGPTGGSGALKWLSGIWQLISDRVPILTLVSDALKVSVVNFPATQTISATSLPLPTNAASQSDVQAVRDRLPVTLGAKTAANSLPVTLSTDGAFATNFGLQADAAAAGDTDTASFLSLFKRLLQRITTLIGSVALDSTLQAIRDRIGDTGVSGATMPTGGVGLFGWLSAIYLFLTQRIPALVSGRIPVDVSSLTVTVANSQIEITNDTGNPISATVSGVASDSTLAEVRDRLMPAAGSSFTQVLANASSGFLKSSAGIFYTMSVINTGTSKKYLLLFNKATIPNSSDTPNRVFPVPAADTLQDGFLFVAQNEIGGGGITFNTGLAWMISTSPTVPTSATASETILGFRWA